MRYVGADGYFAVFRSAKIMHKTRTQSTGLLPDNVPQRPAERKAYHSISTCVKDPFIDQVTGIVHSMERRILVFMTFLIKYNVYRICIYKKILLLYFVIVNRAYWKSTVLWRLAGVCEAFKTICIYRFLIYPYFQERIWFVVWNFV